MATAKQLTAQDIADIKARLRQGEYQHHIAADYGLNQGRVSEINTGKRGESSARPQQLAML
ncbi:Uncharacterised protein [Brevundimonas vesicularis]|uniref:Uncharacterized protein n=1 Tax=Brevundimonas vesicularis TaxID=41276 RepID=A0A2X1BUR6_BREVE|nr:hypothetical protein [Brevundimonas vesicularis]SPU54454.1 Uncharacterised protein [Brevundimonas vesicularis]